VRTLHWDLETEGRPEAEIVGLMPEFSAPGNYRDEAKIAAYIEDARREWLAKAALSPLTGRILLAAVAEDDGPVEFIEGTEEHVVATVLARFTAAIAQGGRAVGFNCHHFDLPYLRQRALLLGVPFPRLLLSEFRGRLSWHERLVDLAALWSFGGRPECSLDVLARAFGLPGKTGDFGACYSALYRTNRDETLRYAAQDVTLVRALYARLDPGAPA
jgi:hypothetical protein